MANLFSRFTSIWGFKWKQHVDEISIEIALYEWSKGLQMIDDEIINNALDYCRSNLEWPPTIAEFRKICGKVAGIPDHREAYQNAKRVFNDSQFYNAPPMQFAHPAIEIAFRSMDSFRFKNLTEKEIDTLWAEIYRNAVEQYTNTKKLEQASHEPTRIA